MPPMGPGRSPDRKGGKASAASLFRSRPVSDQELGVESVEGRALGLSPETPAVSRQGDQKAALGNRGAHSDKNAGALGLEVGPCRPGCRRFTAGGASGALQRRGALAASHRGSPHGGVVGAAASTGRQRNGPGQRDCGRRQCGRAGPPGGDAPSGHFHLPSNVNVDPGNPMMRTHHYDAFGELSSGIGVALGRIGWARRESGIVLVSGV